MSIKIQNSILEAQIKTEGAELISLKKNGKEILWDGNSKAWQGQAPVLFPICGSLRDNKYIIKNKEYSIQKHGFAKTQEFEVENHNSDTVTFSLKSTPETINIYPFEFELKITYTLCNNTLNIRYDIINSGTETMYFSIGSHESYKCPTGIEDWNIIFDKPETLNSKIVSGSLIDYKTTPIIENSRIMPLKYDYFVIDALIFSDLNSRKLTLKNNVTNETAEISFDGFDYLLFWTVPGENFICIEPWCGLPDYVDSDYDFIHKKGIISLESGKSDIRIHSITL